MKKNRVQLIGYVGSDLLTRTLPSGDKKVTLRIATHYATKASNGDNCWHSVWHDVVAWDDTAEYAGRSFVKGSTILVEGSIVYRTYPDKTGHTRYVTEIKAHSLLNLDR